MLFVKKIKTHKHYVHGLKEATTRFELVMTVLQTGALPLGYVALAPRVGLEPTT